MKNRAWRILGAIGLAISVTGIGCVVNSSSDNTGGSAGATSGGGTGGSTGGTGGSTGGTSGTGATGGVAGAGATGGTGGGAGYACDVDGGSVSTTPGSCVPSNPNDTCQACIQQKCCTEWEACLGTNPNNACGFGGPANDAGATDGEIFCFQSCFIDQTNAGKTPDEAKAFCGGSCASPNCGTISAATNDIVTCLDTNCFTECLTQ